MRHPSLPIAVLLAFAFLLGAPDLTAQGKGKGGGGGGSASPEIAFTFTKNNQTHLAVMDADGANQTVIYSGAGDNAPAEGIVWSPEGDRIAFRSGAGLNIINLDGSNLTTIPTPAVSYFDWSPRHAPDGRSKIAYQARDPSTERFDVFVVNTDGSGHQNLTNSSESSESGYPAWSRWGDALAVVRPQYDGEGRWTRTDLVLLDLGVDGGGMLTVVAESVVYEFRTLRDPEPGLRMPNRPRWANHHDWIVLGVVDPQVSTAVHLAILDLENWPSVTMQTLPHVADTDHRFPSFSMDDERIAFGLHFEGAVYTIRTDGTDAQRLTKRNSGRGPNWKRPPTQ